MSSGGGMVLSLEMDDDVNALIKTELAHSTELITSIAELQS